jgi:tripartite-type tricarboxylate transporter receptor subunit TctC
MRKFLEIAFAALLIVSGFVVMSGTPPAIFQRLNQELVRVISDPATKARIAQMGFGPLPGPPQRMVDLIK